MRMNAEQWNELLNRLRRNDPTISELVLEHYEMNDADVKELVSALDGNQIVKYLLICNVANKVGNGGGKALADLLANKNYTLSSVEINFKCSSAIYRSIENSTKRNWVLQHYLYQFAKGGIFSTVNYLLSKGVDPSGTHIAQESLNNTPLHWAVINRHKKMCQALIEFMSKRSMSLARKNKDGKTAQELAAGTELEELFLQPFAMNNVLTGVQINQDSDLGSLAFTFDSNEQIFVRALQDSKPFSKSKLAFKKGDVFGVIDLGDGLFEGDLNGTFGTVQSKYVRDLRLDLQEEMRIDLYRQHLNDSAQAPLDLAREKSNEDIHERRELLRAVWEGNFRKVNILLEKGVNPCFIIPSPDGEKNTPLHWAVVMNHKKIARILM